ncbi:MAG: zinc-ribbon domain-containing protein [Enterocloster clostridioformis]
MGGFNDLATLLPDIAAEWSDRNYPLLPTQVTVFANRKVWWKCKDLRQRVEHPYLYPFLVGANARIAVGTYS